MVFDRGVEEALKKIIKEPAEEAIAGVTPPPVLTPQPQPTPAPQPTATPPAIPPEVPPKPPLMVGDVPARQVVIPEFPEPIMAYWVWDLTGMKQDPKTGIWERVVPGVPGMMTPLEQQEYDRLVRENTEGKPPAPLPPEQHQQQQQVEEQGEFNEATKQAIEEGVKEQAELPLWARVLERFSNLPPLRFMHRLDQIWAATWTRKYHMPTAPKTGLDNFLDEQVMIARGKGWRNWHVTIAPYNPQTGTYELEEVTLNELLLSYENWDAHWALKILLEFTNPITWFIGLGVGAGVAKGIQAAVKGIKGVTMARHAAALTKTEAGRKLLTPLMTKGEVMSREILAKQLDEVAKAEALVDRAIPSNLDPTFRPLHDKMIASNLIDDIKLPKVEELAEALFVNNTGRHLAGIFGKVPGVSRVIEFINPKVLANTPAKRAVIVYRNIMQILHNQATIDMSRLAMIGNPKTLFKIVGNEATNVMDEAGNITKVAIGDLLENAEKFKLTEVQAMWIAGARSVLDKWKRLLAQHGFKWGDIVGKKGGVWFPRIAKDSATLQALKQATQYTDQAEAIYKKVGLEPGFLKTRVFEMMADGIRQGIIYEGNPAMVLVQTLNAMNRAISEKILLNLVKPLGKKVKTADEAVFGFRVIPQQPALNKAAFPTELANYLEKALKDETSKFLRIINDISAIARFVQTGFDWGIATIHLTPLFFRNPRVWGRSMARLIRVFINPENAGVFYQQRIDTIREMIRYGTTFSNSEFVETATQFGYLGKTLIRLTERPEKIVSLPTQTFSAVVNRFQTGFNHPLDVAKILLWDALKPSVVRHYGNQGLFSLASHLDKLMGTLNSTALGIPAGQRAFEAAMLYAPRYLRSALFLIADTVQGGLTSKLALESLGRLAAGITLFYTAVAIGAGQSHLVIPTAKKPIPDGLNPLAGGKFLSIQCGDAYIGLGGIYRAITQMTANIAQTALEEPESFTKFDFQRNSFLKAWRGRMNPIVGMITDVFEGKNFLGEPIDTFPKLTTHIAREFLPFWIEGALELYPRLPETLATTPSEFFGLRAYPMSIWDKRNRKRDEHAKKLYGKPFDELAIDEKFKVNQIPEVKALIEEAGRQWLTRSEGEEKEVRIILNRMDELDKELEKNLNKLIVRIQEGEMDMRTFRGHYNRLRSEHYARKDELRKDPRVQRLYERLEKQMKEEPEERHPFDLLWSIYVETVVSNPNVEKEFGEPDMKAYWDNAKEYREKYGDEAFERARRFHFTAGGRFHPIYRELDKAKEYLENKGYWDLPEGQARVNFRAQDPKADALLYLFGYVTTLRSRSALNLVYTYNTFFGLPVEGLEEALRPTSEALPGLRGGRVIEQDGQRYWIPPGR